MGSRRGRRPPRTIRGIDRKGYPCWGEPRPLPWPIGRHTDVEVLGLHPFLTSRAIRWNVEKNEWRQIESPNTPPPRCSHQAAFFRDHLYVLGGEFATTEQFYHYRDFWRLNIKVSTRLISLCDPSPPPFQTPTFFGYRAGRCSVTYPSKCSSLHLRRDTSAERSFTGERSQRGSLLTEILFSKFFLDPCVIRFTTLLYC